MDNQEDTCLSLLTRLSRISEDDSELYARILKIVGDAVCATSQSLFLTGDAGQLIEVASSGKKVDLIDFVSFEHGAGISAWVAGQKRPIRIGNVKRKSRVGFASILAAPLLSCDKLLGVISLSHDDQDAFDDKHLKILEVLAAQVSVVISRAQTAAQQEVLKRKIKTLAAEVKVMRSDLVECKVEMAREERARNLIATLVGVYRAIKGTADYLHQSYPDDSGLRERCETINGQADLLKQVINRATKQLGRPQRGCPSRDKQTPQSVR